MPRVQAVVGSLDRLCLRRPVTVFVATQRPYGRRRCELAPQLVASSRRLDGIDDEDPARAETRSLDARTRR